MSTLPGGSADKAGGQYEHWWTAARIADVLEGTATSIRLEPPGALGDGAEFTVTQDGATWAEQAKDHASGGTWTIAKLIGDGVLRAAKGHVDAGRNFRLVASTASALSGLCQRARKAQTYDELSASLNEAQRADLRKVAGHWGLAPEAAGPVLRQIDVVHHTRDSLRELVRTRYRYLVSADPDLVIAELRAYCDDHLQESFTAPGLWANLAERGFERRLIVGDGSTIARLHKTIERQQSRVDAAAPDIGFVPRSDVATIVAALSDPGCPQVTVLDGPAGYGKSTIAAQVAAELDRTGWYVAVARMDAVDTTTNTSEKLGTSIGLTDAPVVMLAAVAGGEPVLLVIDQLDAVSSYSGRMADNFESIAETLREASHFDNVKVLLVTRTVDLEADSRLRRLIAPNSGARRHTVGRLPADEVKALLSAAGRAVPTAPSTLDLLRTPLHLSVFSRLDEAGQAMGYRTVQDLYDQYTVELRARVEGRVGHLNWSLVTGSMVGYMSDNELLVAPLSLMDTIEATELQALVSEAAVVTDGTHYAFFHESYFDYLFARGFVAAGHELHDFLAGSGQVLFRRAQTRQVLEHLAGSDRARFRATVIQLLESDQIRFHLKDVVVEVLGRVDATPEDWLALRPIAFGETAIGPRVRSLLGSPRWFDAALETGHWREWLADDDQVDLVYRQLMIAARERGPQVAELVRAHVGSSQEWLARVRSLVEWSLTPGLTDLAIELLDAGRLDDATGRVAVNSDFWSIVYGLCQTSPVDAVRLTGAYLRRALVRAAAKGFVDPFEAQILSIHSQGRRVLAEMRAAAPREFVNEVLPFVITVAMAEPRDRDHLWPAGRRWGYQHLDSSHMIDDAIFNELDAALRQLAADDPALVDEALGQLDQPSAELHFLSCRTLTIRGTADEAIRWLLEDPRNLVLGWADSPRWASRQLIEAWSSSCSQELFEQLEQAVLTYMNPYESRRGTGHGMYELLSAIDPARLSEQGRRRLGELERRFPDRPPQEPTPVEAHVVGPPISDDASKQMSDDDWIRALAKHTSDETNWDGPIPVGGAGELATVLGRRTKEDPVRFAHLGLRLDATIPPFALDHLIQNLPAEIDPELLADVCEHARRLHGEHVGQNICMAIRKNKAPTGRLAALVQSCSTDADPDEELARTPAGPDGQTYFGGDLFMAGLNSTRGEAALAAAHILFATDEHTAVLSSVLQALANDPIIAVRTCAVEGVVAMLNRDEALAFDIAEQLLGGSIDVVDARTTERMLVYLVQRDPDRYAPVLAQALGHSDDVAEHAGVVWAVALLRDTLPSPLPQHLADLGPAARRGAANVLAHNADIAAAHLIELFDDPDEAVRSEASNALRYLDELDPEGIAGLVRTFTDSAAFAEHYESALDALGDMTETLPEVGIEVCERAIEVAGREMGDIRTAAAAAGRQLMTVVLRLYRQGGPVLRSRCLDLIDQLTELGAYGVDRQLEDAR